MKRVQENQVVFYSIKASTIKRFIILDCVTGTAFYYAIKAISTSMILALIGCVVGTEGIKQVKRETDRKH
ncbi:hypothetical protein CKF48_05690 [Cytobacillus kochii]|uniref:Uncharacterized protein n=1 Tax=Cytobacillus kochii TaxID=859143 RepID=A0A248TF74_9BACI|nr:hypothetical protein CKF48_05690 [Cytobacillus kochii]